MGYFCLLCDAITSSTTVNGFIRHYHYRHGITTMQKCTVSCGQHECFCTFDNMHALRMHLKRKHPTDPYPAASGSESYLDVVDSADSSMSDTDRVEIDELNTTADDDKLSVNDIQDMFTDSIIVLKSKNVAQSVVDFVCQGFVTVVTAVTEYCAAPLESVTNPVFAGCLQDVKAMCDSLVVNSDYKIKKYLRDTKGLVEPVSICLGTRTEVTSSKDGDDFVPSIKFVPETMQYISIISTLEKLLCDTDNLHSFSQVEVPNVLINNSDVILT